MNKDNNMVMPKGALDPQTVRRCVNMLRDNGLAGVGAEARAQRDADIAALLALIDPVEGPALPPGWTRYTGNSAPYDWDGQKVILTNGTTASLDRESERWKRNPPFDEGAPYSVFAYIKGRICGNCDMLIRDCECN